MHRAYKGTLWASFPLHLIRRKDNISWTIEKIRQFGLHAPRYHPYFPPPFFWLLDKGAKVIILPLSFDSLWLKFIDIHSYEHHISGITKQVRFKVRLLDDEYWSKKINIYIFCNRSVSRAAHRCQHHLVHDKTLLLSR